MRSYIGPLLAILKRHAVLLAVLSLVLVCGSLTLVGNGAGVTSTLQRAPRDRVVIPPCGSAEATQTTEWTGPQIPGDAPAILGFTPYVITTLPDEVTWSLSVGFGPEWTDGPAPLFHGAYGRWMPRPYRAKALENVIALDETPRSLGLLTNMSATGTELQVTNQSTVMVGGKSGTLFHFSSGGMGAHAVEGIGLLWQRDVLTIRLTVVTSGEYQMLYSGPSEQFDQIRAWPGASEQELMALASHLTPFPFCAASQ